MKTKLALLLGFFLLCAQLPTQAATDPSTVNKKLIKAFNDAFPTAEKVDWSESGDHYFVHFKESAIVSEIEYDHDGNFIASERYYKDASKLPIHLAWEISNRFPGKNVFGITEVNTETDTLYFVKLEDGNEWITVKGVAEGIVNVTEKFRKK